MKRKANLVYGRTRKAWAKLAGISYQMMCYKLKHGYDPRVLIPRKSTCRNIIGLMSTQVNKTNYGKPKERFNISLDNEAVACLETLEKFTGISNASDLIAALAKAAIGSI